jgi:hypothetical protein
VSAVYEARNISMGCGPAFNSRKFEVNSRIVIMKTYWSMTPSRRTCGFAILRSCLARGLRKTRIGGWMEGTKAGLPGILWWGRNCPALADGRQRTGRGAQARYRDPGTAVASEISFWKINGRGGRQAVDTRMDTFCQSPIRSWSRN